MIELNEAIIREVVRAAVYANAAKELALADDWLFERQARAAIEALQASLVQLEMQRDLRNRR